MTDWMSKLLGMVPKETQDGLNQVFENMKRHRRPGETHLDLAKRLTGGGDLNIDAIANAAAGPVQQAPQAVPEPAPPAQPEPQQAVESAPVPAPSPPAQEAPPEPEKVPVYRFKTLPDMDKAMIAAGKGDWQAAALRTGTALYSFVGVKPELGENQNKMHRVYSSGSDDVWEAITMPGPPLKTLAYNRLMIEPVV